MRPLSKEGEVTKKDDLDRHVLFKCF